MVQEYFKKYTSEIKYENCSSLSLNNELKKFLHRKSSALRDEDDLLVGFWAIEYLGVTR